MSRSNKNNRKKIRLSRNGTNEQPLRCSSSSGSSNYSDDMDVIRNAVLESLMKNAGAASGAATTLTPAPKSSYDEQQQQQQQKRKRQDGKSDDESRNNNTSTTTTSTSTVDSSRQNRKLDTPPVARTATIEQLAMATAETESAPNPADDQIRTDVKIVRIKTLDSEESKLLLIVDVLDRNPFRIEVDNEATAAAMAKRRRDEETTKCIKVDIEALKRGECPKEIRNLCTKVRSRRIYKLPDELMRKFDQKGLKVFEWHSFNRPDEVIKLLLDDSGGGGAAGSADSVVQTTVASPAAAAAAADILRKRMIIGFRRRSTSTTASSATSDEPAVKIRRTNAFPVSSVVSGEAKLTKGDIRKSRLTTVDQRSRNRILQRLIKEYSMSSAGGTRTVTNSWDIANQSKINRLVKSHLDLRAKEATERTNNKRKEINNDTTAKTVTMTVTPRLSEARWKSVTNKYSVAVATKFGGTSIIKRDLNLDSAKISLNDDNDGSVSNGNTDVSAIDGNSDALNNSNNDDNDSKAKKKNRCALCRKKVGLTGFECRCGGLYCGIHRYSDKHNCTFDYRQLGAQEIRRNNPVVIGEKIQKI